MGLFQHKNTAKKSLSDELEEAEELLFDAAFRDELKAHGREYIERVLDENVVLFKQDLDATVAHINTELRQQVARQLDQQMADINRVNTELRDHIASRIDEQFVAYTNTMKEAQDKALASLEERAKKLEEQHDQLGNVLQKSFAYQDAMLSSSVEESKSKLSVMRGAQEVAVQELVSSVKALQDQHAKLSQMLDQTIVNQEAMMIQAFEDNMSRTIEHYLVTALGDQYDLKAQLPAIIQQMEANKQAMVDDMKL
jgi:uncharacterized protein YbjQ (UPF0145 family)